MATRLPARRIWSLLSLSLPLFCAGISAVVAEDPADYTYRTSSNEVRLSFSATDQNNHAVAALQSSDFAVVDKDVIVRNFQSFTRSDRSRLEIAILVDASGSVSPRFRQELADVLNLVSQTAGIPDENIAIFSFQRAAARATLCRGLPRLACRRIPPKAACQRAYALVRQHRLCIGFSGQAERRSFAKHSYRLLGWRGHHQRAFVARCHRCLAAKGRAARLHRSKLALSFFFWRCRAADSCPFHRRPLFRAARRGCPRAPGDSGRLASKLHGQLSNPDPGSGISHHPDSSHSQPQPAVPQPKRILLSRPHSINGGL